MGEAEGGKSPGRQSPGPEETGHSVLRALGRGGIQASQVLLRDDHSDPTPLVKTKAGAMPSGGEGRYQVLGEIARGGVGIVQKAHDSDIGRDIAMKVLRDEYSQHKELLERFVEEAQIGGQLQHPGIVPVYELGIRGEGRPYFTMKLVKGRNLLSLMEERKSPTEDLQRFLGIFDSVCQTMAYAHARGVVHRDLKPNNVMVGAFGEVQVVDWGLAKVMGTDHGADALRRREEPAQPKTMIATHRSSPAGLHSRIGSVLGTPAYMPPEQARGDVENLDERSDVFALGAILCEVLTGLPPYASEGNDVLVQAARAEQAEMKQRLASCGADPFLVQLAESCLSPSPEARPRDAGAVAKEVSHYRATIEERARKASEDAAAAQVREDEGKRRDRLRLLLVASVGTTLVLAGGVYAWMRTESGRRVTEAVALVEDALQEATRLRSRASVSRGAAEWHEALLAARGARTMAEGKELAGDLRKRLDDLCREVESEEDWARRREEQARTDRELARVLEGIRLDALSRSAADPEDRFREAFRAYDLDVDAMDPPKAAARMMGTDVQDRVADALEAWASARRAAGRTWKPLQEAAALLDRDAFRDRLRAASGTGELRALAGQVDPETVTARNAVALAMALREAGDTDTALSVLGVADRAHPGDLWVHCLRGEVLLGCAPPRSREAARDLTAALALRPGNAAIHARLGTALMLDGDFRGAGIHLERAIELGPGDADTLVRLGDFRLLTGDIARASEAFRGAARARPGWAPGRAGLSHTLMEAGDFEGALLEARAAAGLPGGQETGRALEAEARRMQDLDRRLAEVLRMGASAPGDPREALDLAPVAYRKGLYAGASALYATALQGKVPGTEDPVNGVRLAAACAAARAGAGEGDARSLGTPERQDLRERAQRWLAEDLVAWDMVLRRDPVRSPAVVRPALARMCAMLPLGSLRDPDAISGLPAVEQASLRAFWEDAEALRWRADR